MRAAVLSGLKKAQDLESSQEGQGWPGGLFRSPRVAGARHRYAALSYATRRLCIWSGCPFQVVLVKDSQGCLILTPFKSVSNGAEASSKDARFRIFSLQAATRL